MGDAALDHITLGKDTDELLASEHGKRAHVELFQHMGSLTDRGSRLN